MKTIAEYQQAADLLWALQDAKDSEDLAAYVLQASKDAGFAGDDLQDEKEALKEARLELKAAAWAVTFHKAQDYVHSRSKDAATLSMEAGRLRRKYLKSKDPADLAAYEDARELYAALMRITFP